MTSNPTGRIMAVDLGEKRIGVAISDALGIAAKPVAVIKRTSRKADYAKMATLVEEHGISRLLFGLPLHVDGSESQMSLWVRNYSAEAAKTLNLPCVLWDETYSSQSAEANMTLAGIGKKKKRAQIDAHAAAHFLQDFLDSAPHEQASAEQVQVTE